MTGKPRAALHITALRARFGALQPNLAASWLMILSFLVFSCMAVMARSISGDIPVIEMVLVRQAMAMLFMAPLFWRRRSDIRHPRRPGLHALRGVTAVGAMTCGLSAVILIPLADATAIQMAEVLLVTAFAALLLREKVGWRRWLATAVGFVGVAIMVRPFGAGVDPFAAVALLGALFGACNMVILRVGASADRIETVLFWQGIVVLVLVTPPAVWFWVTPDAGQAVTLLGMSLIYTLGMWLFTTALRMGETSALAPLHYLRLILMAATGWLVYSEIPTWPTVIGAGLVLGAATYTLQRNAQMRPADPASDPSVP